LAKYDPTEFLADNDLDGVWGSVQFMFGIIGFPVGPIVAAAQKSALLEEAMAFRGPALVNVMISQESARKPQQFRWHS
jgi:hypothetical protein